MRFSRMLKSTMEEKGITNYRLAKMLGVHQTTVKNWLEEVTTPTAKTARRIANILGVSLDGIIFSDYYFFRYAKVLMKQNNITTQQLAAKLEVDQFTIDFYFLNNLELSFEQMTDMAEAFGKTLDEYIAEGSLYFGLNFKEAADMNVDQLRNEMLTPSEFKHVKKYRTLDEHGKKIVDLVLNEEAERVKASADSAAPIEKT